MRYFFHTADGVEQIDAAGVEFADLRLARAAAVAAFAEILHDLSRLAPERLSMSVTDKDGLVVSTINLTISP